MVEAKTLAQNIAAEAKQETQTMQRYKTFADIPDASTLHCPGRRRQRPGNVPGSDRQFQWAIRGLGKQRLEKRRRWNRQSFNDGRLLLNTAFAEFSRRGRRQG